MQVPFGMVVGVHIVTDEHGVCVKAWCGCQEMAPAIVVEEAALLPHTWNTPMLGALLTTPSSQG